ncbi:MAG TPA: branched-chain amino acid ABC transporter permease [Kofleriaceae bacterium]|nr:branched-chain amino acid ABC transporter permease [Kofleriaceae bacterium]
MTGPGAAAGLPSDRWRVWDTALWLAPVVAFFAFPGRLVLGSQVIITALFALSLDIILGHAGIVSLGHAAFFGLGAYTAGLLAAHGWGEPLSGLLCAGVVAGAAGFATSFLVVRGAALTQLMITLGVGLLLFEAANRASELTGGVDGLSDIAMWRLLGLFRFDLAGRVAYVYSLTVALVGFLVVRRVLCSPFGLSLRAIREGAVRMPALGVPVGRRLVAAFTLAAAIAGVAGGLLSQTTQFVGLDVLSFPRSAAVLIMLVLGGAGRLYGAFIGAALFMLMQDYLARLDAMYWQLWIGVLLVAVVLFGRGGVLGLAETARDRLRRPR